jgi:signal transduction histidine kinase
MLRKYFRYILLSVFFTAVLLIVFLQFNSNRSINQLINGNENLMAELRLKNALQELQTAIVTAENRVKEAVIENEIDQLKNLQQEVAGINTMLQRLDSMINDKNTDALLLKLQEFVKQKTNFNYSVLDTFSASGKRAAEKLIDRQAESHIIDSIKAASQQISDLRQQTVTALTLQADADGTRAKSLGTTLAILAALAAVFAFGYVSNRVRIQGILIAQLNESEKKAREAVVIKENFMANMSHEIRTPLNAILGFTNLLQRKKNDEETQQYINAIQRSGENLLGIVNDVLDFSKIEAGMLRIESAPFSISGLLHSVITMFKVKLAEKNIEIRHTLDESIPDTLEGDASRLTQILVNLIGNAVKFTTEGYIHITAKAVNTDKEKVWVKFSVADTGIGIDSAKQTTIFERFQQADSNASRKFGGTGLGLSIAKELVELQQGTIGVSSLPGKGSTFYFTIPYHISSEQFTKPILAANPGLPPHSNTHIRILVAEDNEMNQKLLQHLLSNWHLNFTIVNNGAEAVELLQQKHFDLILKWMAIPLPG